MAKKITIPQQNQPFRRQSSLGGNVSFRNLGGTDNNNYVVMAVVTKVYYKQGRVDFRLTNSTNHVVTETGDGTGSAPIPVDFYGYQRDGKIFGHYRPIQIGDLIAVAYLWGHKQAPIVLGVYPKDSSSYEFVAPQEASSSGDDKDEAIYDYALGDQKIFPDGSLEYHSGNGKYFKTLRGKSFMLLDDSPLYEHLWVGYNDIGAFKDSDQNTINPLQEEAGDWLLVHEDNNEGSNSTDHRTRFYVSKDGTFQVVLSKSSKLDNLVILEGSKSNGFTLQELYDVPQKGWIGEKDPHKEPDIKNAQQYVKFNLGGPDRSATVEAATKDDSVEQATKLKIKDDGIYVNGKVLVSSNPKYTGKTIIDDTINNSEGLNDAINKVQDAVEQARQAGEAAKEAGLSAEVAGKSAKSIGDNIKKNIIYYASISKEKDVSIPGKYIIVNTDTYIAKGTIKNAYIEDGAIDQAKIADAAIDSAQIKNGAITTAKIADLAVGSAQIEDLAVTDEKVGKLTFDHMSGATLDADKIKVINLTADNIKVHSISADILNIGQLSDITGDIGKITKGHIQAGDDSNSGVKIDGLDADNPNKYTPSKKAFLLSEVKKLNSAAEAAIDYGKSTGVDATSVENAKEAMDNGLAGLLGNLTETTEFDYNTVIKLEQDLQNAINAFHNNANSDIIAQIGTTANGKNAIYRGANEPQNPNTNDVWLQILNDGTYNIRVWDGGTWINPGLADIKAVENSLSNLPKSYYQAEEPVGDNVHDGDTWYKLTKGSDGKYTYVAYKRESNSWTLLLNAGEVSNQSSINTLQSDLEQARKLIEDDGGGINLLTGTGNNLSITGTNTSNQTIHKYLLTNGYNVSSLASRFGTQFTLSFDWSVSGSSPSGTFHAQWDNVPWDLDPVVTVSKSNTSGHVSGTFSVSTDSKNVSNMMGFRLDNFVGTLTVSNMKLEKGSQATPWCRNGNDYIAGIAAVQEDVNSATAAIQQAKTNAANDAAKIRADVARIESEVASAKSASQDSINALQNDIDAAKKDLADTQSGLLNAQSAIEQNQKLINDSVTKINNDIAQNRKDLATTSDQLTSAQKSITDNRQALESSVTDINSKIAQDRKNIVAAQQANTDTAKKLDSYTKQATEQGNTIKELQTDNDSTKLTIADIKGNVSQVQSSVTGLTANLKDTNDNLAAVKSTADSLSATIADHNKNISALQATAQSLSSTLSDASGRLSKVEQTAQEHSVTIGNLRSEVEWKQVSSNSLLNTMKSAGHFWGTGKDFTGKPGHIKDTDQVRVVVEVPSDDSISQILYANNIVWQRSFNSNTWSEWVRSANQSDVDTLQGNITQVKQTADGLTTTLRNAQGDITNLQTTARGLSEQITNAQGDITALQTDVTGIKATIADHDKNIHTLQADAKSLTDNMEDAQGNISSLQKTATSLDSELKNHDGRISKVEQTASTLTTEFSDEQGHLNRVEQTANGTQQTVADQQGQINKIKTDASGIHETLTGQGNQIANINVTLNGLNTKYEGVSGDLGKLKSQAQWVTVTSAVDLNNVKTPCHEFLKGTVTNAPNETAWWYLTVEGSESGRITQTVIADQSNNRYTRRWADGWSAWVKDATQTDITALSDRITTNSTQITQNQQAIALKANQSTVDNLSGEVSQNKAQLKVQADQISSKVSSSDFKTLNNKVSGAIARIDENATAIDQTNKQISLKANQTDVDKINGTVNKNSSLLDVMSGQISSKVTSTDVNNIVDKKGYATTDTVQSLIIQKADSIEAGITGKLSSGDYGGVILDKNGVTLTSGNTHVYLNGTNGFQIQNNTSNVFRVDRSGNLTMQGTITGGDIYGVNFSGENLTLAGDLKVSGGHIILGDGDTPLATLDSNGISLKDGGLSITDKEGHQTTYINNDGTFTTTKGVFSGSVKATSLTLTGEYAKIDVAGNFVVNSGGHVTANSITITGGTIDAGNTKFDNFSANYITTGTLKGVELEVGDTDGKTIVRQDGIVSYNKPINVLPLGERTPVTKIDHGVIRVGYVKDVNNIDYDHDNLAEIGTDGTNTLGIKASSYYLQTNSGSEYAGISSICTENGGNILLDINDDKRQKTYIDLTKGGIDAGGEDIGFHPNNIFQVNLNSSKDAQFAIQKDNRLGIYFGVGSDGNRVDFTALGGLNMNTYTRFNNEVYIPSNGLTVKNLHVTSWLGVDGSKNSIVNTSQGTVAINAYETAEYYFGDIGEGQTNSNGIAYIGIEKLFKETVNTNIPYQVFLTAYGPGDIWVAQREHNWFVVKSNQPNIKFGWEIKAKRKGYEHTRLKNVDNMIEKPAGLSNTIDNIKIDNAKTED